MTCFLFRIPVRTRRDGYHETRIHTSTTQMSGLRKCWHATATGLLMPGQYFTAQNGEHSPHHFFCLSQSSWLLRNIAVRPVRGLRVDIPVAGMLVSLNCLYEIPVPLRVLFSYLFFIVVFASMQKCFDSAWASSSSATPVRLYLSFICTGAAQAEVCHM